MDTEVQPGEKLRGDEGILQVIDECISSRDHDYERNKEILREILEDVFTTMKGRNTFFQEQFQGFFFVENCYKGPKVGKPEEFRVNIIIKVPLDFKYIQFGEEEPGYKMLQFPNGVAIHTSQWDKHKNFLSKWLVWQNHSSGTNRYYMNKDVFRKSIESVLALNILNVPRIDNYTIKVREDNAGFTLCVSKHGFPEMNVNLMPVIEFVCKSFSSQAKEGFKWYAVPDPSKDVNHKFQWRLLMYNHDNEFLTRHIYLMPTIRQLQKLRDTQEWNVIPYYHIKTLVMHYAKSMENDSGLPGTFKLTGIKLLIHMLDRLRNMCQTQYLQNFWHSGHNLIHTNHSQFADIVEQLTRMINEIIDNPAKMVKWILTSEEVSMYRNELKTVGVLPDTDCPSKSLQTSVHDEACSSNDICNTDRCHASGGTESSPSNEAGEDIASYPEKLDSVDADFENISIVRSI